MTVQPAPRFRLLAVLAWLTLCATPGAHAASEDSARLYELSGLRLQIEAVVQAPLQGLDSASGLSPVLLEAMHRAASRPVDLQALHANSLKLLDDRLDENRVHAALDWLTTPAGRRITEAEIRASQPDAAQGLMDYGRTLAGDPPPPARRDLVIRIMRAVDGAEQAREIMLASSLATALGMNAMAPKDQQLSPGALRQRLERELGLSRRSLEPMVLLGLFYAYRELSDADLEGYLAYLESDDGRHYTDVTSRAVLDTLSRFTFDFGRAIAEELESGKGRRAL